MHSETPPTIVMAATVPGTVFSFMAEQVEAFLEQGWRVQIVTSNGPKLNEFSQLFNGNQRLSVHPIDMSRIPSPRKDARALRKWIRTLGQLRPDVLLVGTPKAAMLGLLAGSVRRIPVRIYVVRGLRFEGLRGLNRRMNMFVEWMACRLATDVVCVSHSVRLELIQKRLAPSRRLVVLGGGSSHGVDVDRFEPRGKESKQENRARLGLPAEALIVGFAGRITRDKGIFELAVAIRELAKELPQAHLAIAGSREGEPPLAAHDVALLESDNISILGRVEDIEQFYSALDIFCLPSRREGFPNVVLEALASAIPVVTTTATGCRDSVQHGVDGLLVPPGDIEALRGALAFLATREDLRRQFGDSGRIRVGRDFSVDSVSLRWVNFVRMKLIEGGAP